MSYKVAFLITSRSIRDVVVCTFDESIFFGKLLNYLANCDEYYNGRISYRNITTYTYKEKKIVDAAESIIDLIGSIGNADIYHSTISEYEDSFHEDHDKNASCGLSTVNMMGNLREEKNQGYVSPYKQIENNNRLITRKKIPKK